MSQSVQVVERPILFSGEMVKAILEGRKTQTRRVVKPQPTTFTGEGAGVWRHVNGAKWESGLPYRCPYGKPGDRLWVREKWKCAWTFRHGHGVLYAADDRFSCFNGCCNNLRNGKVSGGPSQPGYDWIAAHYGNDHRIEPWRPSIHMPRWASRLTLEIVKVRVERLQEITPGDCEAEGVQYPVAKTSDPAKVQPLLCISDRKLTPHLMEIKGKHTHENLMVAHFAGLWDSINSKRGHGWDKNDWVWAITFQRVRS